MYTPFYSKSFEKSYQKIRRGGKVSRLQVESVVKILTSGKKLGVEYRDHELKGEWSGYRECHIKGDLLLVYQIRKTELILVLIDIGSHSYLDL